MRSKLVLGSLFACAILIACSSSNNSSVLDDTDAGGGDDSDKPSTTKKDSGTSSTKDAGKDSGKPKPDVPEGGGEDGGGTAKVGDSCTSTADCSGAVASICSNEAYGDDTVYAQPICLGSCSGDLTACDGANTLCDDYDGSGGICYPKCTASTTAVTLACPGKTACWLLSDDGAGGAVGECTWWCTADSDCSGGDKCQTESGTCVKDKTVYPKDPGDACTAKTDCAGCIAPTDKPGFCTKLCVVGDANTCPAGLSCHIVDMDPTVFDANPTKSQGQCMKECTTNADCTTVAADQASWECTAVPGGKSVCAPAE